MNVEIIKNNNTQVSYCKFPEKHSIATTSDFLEVLLNCGTDTVAIDKDSLVDSFFDLRSGLAGDFLQKVSNYRKRLIIIGDFSTVESESLKSFIYESNRGGTVLFVDDLAAGIELLR
jgi:hypothetical protein